MPIAETKTARNYGVIILRDMFSNFLLTTSLHFYAGLNGEKTSSVLYKNVYLLRKKRLSSDDFSHVIPNLLGRRIIRHINIYEARFLRIGKAKK